MNGRETSSVSLMSMPMTDVTVKDGCAGWKAALGPTDTLELTLSAESQVAASR